MNLISDSERSEIRQLIAGDVKDTFFNTPCTISVLIDSADRMGRQAGQSFTPYNLNCLREFGHLQSDQTFMNVDGSVIKADVKVTLVIDDMGTLNMLDGFNQPIINMATDKLRVDGVDYRIVYCGTDGDLGETPNLDKPLICIIMGDREPAKT